MNLGKLFFIILYEQIICYDSYFIKRYLLKFYLVLDLSQAIKIYMEKGNIFMFYWDFQCSE